MIIAIDGPAGSGKSTVAKLLAEKLNFLYLDTGAMYRALTYWLIKNNINPCLEERVVKELKKINIEFKEEKVFLNGEDVSLKIRQPLIEENISLVAKNPQVREVMVTKQREIAKNCSCVAEGRDTTTVVFPYAQVKIYLDADFSERVRRRALDFKKKNIKIEEDKLREDLRKRDEADITRKVSPLKKAEDAIYIDTTNLKIEEVVSKIYNIVLEKQEYGNR
ncbi:MAG TPA: (d)CMP kinase [Candidatus Omnitrophica bacterium]|nr:MAG: (d)CMP kinase [Candidatus Omnitrophota bacterium]HEC69500.1 (d)CMP kinase [Candidatus Omnitrophota bacterium]